MAGARVEKLGTIFTRATGLLRARALRWEDRPLWYDIYAIHSPSVEPEFYRPEPPADIVRPIWYREDLIRARFAKEVDRRAHPEQFMRLYQDSLKETKDEEQAFQQASKVFIKMRKTERRAGRPRHPEAAGEVTAEPK